MRRRTLVVSAILLGGGCSRDGPPGAPPICFEHDEARAMACSSGEIRRVADTLFVRLPSGRESTFVDTKGEAPGGYHYSGWIGRARFHLIESYGHEAPPSWLVVNRATGRSILAYDQPVLSPDGERFVTASDSWNNCTELDHPRLEVWRLTDTLPASEWILDPWNCRTDTGWGPTQPRWRGPDTIEFLRNDPPTTEVPQPRPRPGRAVRSKSGWRILE